MPQWHSYPFVRLLLPLITGIVLFNYFPMLYAPAALLAMGAGCIFLLVFIQQGFVRMPAGFGILVNLLLISLGLFLSGQHVHSFTPPLLEENAIVLASVREEPVKKTRSVKTEYTLEAIWNGGQWQPLQLGALVYSPPDSQPRLVYGDYVLIRTRWEIPRNPANPDQFNYPEYLRKRGIYYQAYCRQGSILPLHRHKPAGMQHYIHATRRFVNGALERLSLTGRELAVASALLIGYKEELDSDTKASYSRAGAMHILAVSGLHVGIVFMMLSRALFFLKRRPWQQWLQFTIILAFLWFYALLSGFSPSVLRATVMFSFMLPGTIWKLPVNIYNTIALSAFFLLLTDTSMLFDVGFQLSYAAVIGIVILYPRMQYWWVSRYRILRWIWSLTAVSLAAQLATFPLTLYYFGQFPNYFLPANLVVVPLSGVIIYAGVASILLAYVPWLGDVAGWCMYWLIRIMNETIFAVEHLPFSYADNLPLTAFQALLTYLFICAGVLFFRYRRPRYLFFTLGCALVFLCTTLWRQSSLHQQHYLVIYNLNKTSYLEVISGKTAYHLDADTLSEMNYGLFVRPFHQRRGISSNLSLRQSPVYYRNAFLAADSLTLFILDSTGAAMLGHGELEVDYVWIRYGYRIRPDMVMPHIRCREVILDNRLSARKELAWKTYCDSAGIRYHSMRSDGAWIREW